MIGIINYQRGNLNNVARAFEYFGFATEITDNPARLDRYQGVVLPGVGAFADAMQTLRETGFDQALCRYIASDRPFLGICLGLQLLFERGLEFGEHEGLGILKGRVRRFEIEEKVPHMGWNTVSFQKPSSILKGIHEGDSFYFVHSYYVEPEEPGIALTLTHYGIDFVSAVEKGNLVACQFHPEKSQERGLKMIQSFGEFCADYTRH